MQPKITTSNKQTKIKTQCSVTDYKLTEVRDFSSTTCPVVWVLRLCFPILDSTEPSQGQADFH